MTQGTGGPSFAGTDDGPTTEVGETMERQKIRRVKPRRKPDAKRSFVLHALTFGALLENDKDADAEQRIREQVDKMSDKDIETKARELGKSPYLILGLGKKEQEHLLKVDTESVLTLIAMSDENGQKAIGMIEPRFFVEPYFTVATRIIDYRNERKRPPGVHLDDLLSDILSNEKDARRDEFLKIVRAILDMNDKGLDEQYVMDNLGEWIHLRKAQLAWMASAEPLRQGNVGRADELISAYLADHAPDTNASVMTLWPVLDDHALTGLPGDIVRAIEPYSEADPAALLAGALCFFGNAVGRGAHFLVSARHHANLNIILAGETSKGRKGVATDDIRMLFTRAVPDWAMGIRGGLSSGEGLIDAVKPIDAGDDKNPLVEGKRMLVIELEFASPLKRMANEGNTLSQVLRLAWDGSALATMTRSHPKDRVEGAHISVYGNTNFDELRRYFDDLEALSGLANRFLFVCAKRSKVLSLGGNIPDAVLAPLVQRIKDALEWSYSLGNMEFSADALEDWDRIYKTLSEEPRSGLLGAVTARADPQTRRLAMIYALMDQSAKIEQKHLDAAVNFYIYCEQSAVYIFGRSTGNAMADAIIEALQLAGISGLSKSVLSGRFGKNPDQRKRMNDALNSLERTHVIRVAKAPTAGRATTKYFLVKQEGD